MIIVIDLIMRLESNLRMKNVLDLHPWFTYKCKNVKNYYSYFGFLKLDECTLERDKK